MIQFELNNKTYKINGWQDITLGRFCTFIETVLPKQPKILKEILEAEDKEQARLDVTIEEELQLLDYYCLAVAYWFSIDADTLKIAMDREQLERSYWALEVLFSDYQIDEDFVSFRLHGVDYFVPANYMQDSTTIEYFECMQFEQNLSKIEGGNFLALPEILATICRPKDEAYNEKKVPIRKKLFKQVNMLDALNVAFFLLRLKGVLAQTLAIYSLLEASVLVAPKPKV